jgi:hypothetical protein
MLEATHPPDGKPAGSLRPADECPFARPFPEGFDECPTFGPQPFVPIDMSYRPLPPMLTCTHLLSRTLPKGKVGWYAACKLGDEAARRKLAEVRAS